MFSSHSRINSIQLFDCEYIERCWKCNQTCYSGLRIWLQYKFDISERKHIALCKMHSLLAVKCNVVDLPLNTCEFLFSRKYAGTRREYLDKLQAIEELTPQALLDSFQREEIDYWYEPTQGDNGSIHTLKSVKAIESSSGKRQAVIYHCSDQTFKICHYCQDYVEYGEWKWIPERTSKNTFAGDFRSAVSIAILELEGHLQ